MPVFSVQQGRRPTPAEPNAAEFLRWSKISCEAWVGMSPSDRIGWARSYYYLSVLGGNAPPPYSEVAITKLVDQTNEFGLLDACPALVAEPSPVVPQAIRRPQNPFGVASAQQPASQARRPPPVAMEPSGVIAIQKKYALPLILAAAVVTGGVAYAVSKKKNKRRR
jgi:hypothetical protein